MDLAQFVKIQIEADEKRGFSVRFVNDHERVSQLIKDLVGLFGEIGEFSNLVKKIEIKLGRPAYEGPSLAESRGQLGEEISDCLIYLFRLAAVLEVDIEHELLEKMGKNEKKYKSLESRE